MILGLDLATNLGASWGDGSRLPQLDHHRLASTGEDVGAFVAEFEDWFRAKLDQVAPTFVAFEAPILPRTTSPITVRKLTGLAAVLELVCYRENIDCEEAITSQVKKALTGYGAARKPAMVSACRRFGLTPFAYVKDREEQSDEADAFGVWLTAVRARCPEHRAFWEAPLPLIDGVIG